jgi:hypothetical protein
MICPRLPAVSSQTTVTRPARDTATSAPNASRRAEDSVRARLQRPAAPPTTACTRDRAYVASWSSSKVAHDTTARPCPFTASSREAGRVPRTPAGVRCSVAGSAQAPPADRRTAFTTRPADHARTRSPSPSNAICASVAPRVPGTRRGCPHDPDGCRQAAMTRERALSPRVHTASAVPSEATARSGPYVDGAGRVRLTTGPQAG